MWPLLFLVAAFPADPAIASSQTYAKLLTVLGLGGFAKRTGLPGTSNIQRTIYSAASSRSEDVANFTGKYELVQKWPSLPDDLKLGQVSAVSMNKEGILAVLHRGDREWVPNTFDRQNRLRNKEAGAISVETVLFIHPDTGKLMGSWGKSMFYLPHGLTIDHQDNLWIADVGAHQVYKYAPTGAKLMELGTLLEPGADNYHFCKPSSVAVEQRTGHVFVADGYCNSHIMKFSSDGSLLAKVGKTGMPALRLLAAWIRRPKERDFNIVHKLALDQERGVLFVADRENGRVQALMTSDFTYVGSLSLTDFGGRMFAVSYTPAFGGMVLSVNGPKATGAPPVQGFVLNPRSRDAEDVITAKFGGTRLREAHDIYATTDGSAVYVAETNPHRLSKYVLK